MRNFMRNARRAEKAGKWIAACVLGTITFAAPVLAGDGIGLRRSYGDESIVTHTAHSSHLKLTQRDRLPQTREVRVGTSKSMLVELPRDLRDVVVSNPEILDAVVQTSNRVYLIGKKVGQTNRGALRSTTKKFATERGSG